MTYIGNQDGLIGPEGVKDYLVRHGVSPEDVDAALTDSENIAEIETAVRLRSHNFHPATEIAERQRWILTYDPDEDADDDDDEVPA